MIELLVVLGVVLILIGIIVPALGSSIERARNTAELATIRSNVALVSQHAAQTEGYYPIATPSRCGSSTRWYEPLLASGLISSEVQVDPRSFPKFGEVSFSLSESLVADVAEFTWGSTRSCVDSPSSPVGESDVAAPSAKGMMVRTHDPGRMPAAGYAYPGQSAAFCCTDLWIAPVAFCDGSGVLGTYLDFAPPGGPTINRAHRVGVPILSPWNGYLARER